MAEEQVNETNGTDSVSKIDNEISWSEVRKLLQESMKRTSDYAGAILRLGLLTVLITFLAERISKLTFLKDGYFLALGALLVVLSVVWMTLAMKIFSYTFANLAVVIMPRDLLDGPAFEVKPNTNLRERFKLHVRKQLSIWKIFLLAGLLIAFSILVSVAAFYELAAFIDRPQP